MAKGVVRTGRSDDVDAIWYFALPKEFLAVPVRAYKVKMGKLGDGTPYLVVKCTNGGLAAVKVDKGNAKGRRHKGRR